MGVCGVRGNHMCPHRLHDTALIVVFIYMSYRCYIDPYEYYTIVACRRVTVVVDNSIVGGL